MRRVETRCTPLYEQGAKRAARNQHTRRLSIRGIMTTFRLPADELDQSFIERIKAMFRKKQIAIVIYEENELPLELASSGTLDYYMSHPIKIEDFPPFDRDAIYSDRLG
jgi:hypothetical protein